MLISVSPSIGLPALAALVLGESAGLPIPGETALIVSGGLAASGQLSLPLVIAVAAMSAIVGDMIGYWVGRRGGRKLLLRDGRFSAHRRSAVATADRYFERYGVVTVFFARFVPGVRVVGAVAAGTTQMRFRNFAIANALGCWAWATTVATIAYLVGPEGAAIMVIAGFAIAGVGVISAIRHARHTEHDDAIEAPAAVATQADPFTALQHYAGTGGSAPAGRAEPPMRTRPAKQRAVAASTQRAPAQATAAATSAAATQATAVETKPAAAKAPAVKTSVSQAAMTLAACTNRLP